MKTSDLFLHDYTASTHTFRQSNLEINFLNGKGSTHGYFFDAFELSIVSVVYLAVNTFSEMQSPDDEIIVGIKLRHFAFQLGHALNLCNEIVISTYKTGILSGMQTMKMKWKYIGVKIIMNCWKRSKSKDRGATGELSC